MTTIDANSAAVKKIVNEILDYNLHEGLDAKAEEAIAKIIAAAARENLTEAISEYFSEGFLAEVRLEPKAADVAIVIEFGEIEISRLTLSDLIVEACDEDVEWAGVSSPNAGWARVLRKLADTLEGDKDAN